jgi:hypothetical protein
MLSRNATPIDWTDAQTVTTTNGITWRLNNLAALTANDGNYVLTFDPGANLVQAFPGNPVVVGDSESWQVDATPPTVTITPVVPNASFGPTNTISIVFSEPVSGPDKGDLVLTHRGVVVPLTAAQLLTTTDNQTWTLTNLAPLTGQPGKYELSLQAVGSGIDDAAANSLTVGAFTTWRVLIPGDLSGDNRVGLKDLGRLGRNLGLTSATPEQGDLNGDTTVGRPDLVTLLGVYGTSLPPLGSGAVAHDAAGATGAPGEASAAAQGAAYSPRDNPAPTGDTNEPLPIAAAFESIGSTSAARSSPPGARRFARAGAPQSAVPHDEALNAYLLSTRSRWTAAEDASPSVSRRDDSVDRAATEEAFTKFGANPFTLRRDARGHRLARVHSA